MRAAFATSAGSPDRPNEDFAACTAKAVVLLDGAGTPPGSGSGCVHGVAWFSRTLGTALLAMLDAGERPAAGLAVAIEEVRDRHSGECDLSHPGSPSATVIAIQRTRDALEYLVLADSTLLLRGPGGVRVLTDDREAVVGQQYRTTMDALPSGTPEHADALRDYVVTMRQHRNTPNGFWVASADPCAATEAITGTVELDDVHDLALLSDGASRLADRFDLMTWPQTLDLLAHQGPGSLVEEVRAAEDSDPTGSRWPRGKAHDDATAVYVQV